MASSSSPNQLANSYFLYGTHPLKVPNILVHANSTTGLSNSSTDQNSNHLSLNLPNSNYNNYHYGFSSAIDLTTTKSLYNLSTDDDENNEVNKATEKQKRKRDISSSFLITYICHCPNNIMISLNINK
jgi:hypothetical protein